MSSSPSAVTTSLRGWARWAWRTLTAMRTAVVLLALVAAAAIPGSVFPQRNVASDPSAVASYRGRYWGWDRKETWAFITWVLYAAYLHAQATAGWRGVKASWFAIAAYGAFVFNFFGVKMWITTGLHSYAGV